MPGRNESDKLFVEIENLRKDLKLSFETRKSLTHSEIIAISMLLDEKLIQYMKLEKDNNPENDLIKETVMIYSIKKSDVRADKKKCCPFC